MLFLYFIHFQYSAYLWQYANSYAKICQPYAKSRNAILQIYKSA